MIKLPAETLGRKQNHTDSLCRQPFFVDSSLGRKQEITKISGLVYTLCCSGVGDGDYLLLWPKPWFQAHRNK